MATKKGSTAKGKKAAKSSRKGNTTFLSSLSISKIAESAGNASDTRAALEADLQSKGIDTSVATSNLPSGADADLEAVARLISLARGHGLFVQVAVRGDETSFDIVTPSSAGMLQSRHDRG
jgi:hypothetical protein